MNAKVIGAVVAAAFVAGIGTCILMKRETDRLRAEHQSLIAKCERVAEERDAAFSDRRAAEEKLERMRRDQAELLRLRSEVGQMRRQLEAEKTSAQSPRGKATEREIPRPGAYVTKEQLAHVGYGTAEAALQTMTWAIMSGSYDQANESLSPEMLADQLKDPKGREEFEAGLKVVAPLFKGFQILAKKVLAEDKVELKVKTDKAPIPGQPQEPPPFTVQPMVKIGDVWKRGGSTRGYQETWESEGEIQRFVP